MTNERASTAPTPPDSTRGRPQTQGGKSSASLRLLIALVGGLGLLALAGSGRALPDAPVGAAATVPPAGTTHLAREATIGSFGWPNDVEIDGRGWLYVSDRASASVVAFDRNRRLVGALGVGEPETPGVLAAPMGIAAAPDGVLYVADRRLRRVMTYDALGAYLGEFGTPALERDGRVPAALFLRDGLLYVTDIGRHQVLVLDRAGSLVRVVGLGEGAGVGELSYPNGIWVGDDGVIWVSDSNNDRIQRFSAVGTPLGVWGDRVASPRDLVRDAAGRVYVASALANRVVVLDPGGRRIEDLASVGGRPLMAPTGVAISGNGIYATDRLAGAVVEWSAR